MLPKTALVAALLAAAVIAHLLSLGAVTVWIVLALGILTVGVLIGIAARPGPAGPTTDPGETVTGVAVTPAPGRALPTAPPAAALPGPPGHAGAPVLGVVLHMPVAPPGRAPLDLWGATPQRRPGRRAPLQLGRGPRRGAPAPIRGEVIR